MKKIFWLLTILLTSSIAVAAEAQAPMPMLPDFLINLVKSWPGLDKFIVYVVSFEIVMWALGEAFTRMSAYTESNWDNKLGAWCTEAAWLIGVVLGKFGFSVPKLVMEEKIDQAKAPEAK